MKRHLLVAAHAVAVAAILLLPLRVSANHPHGSYSIFDKPHRHNPQHAWPDCMEHRSG
jgi:hypothetical protein